MVRGRFELKGKCSPHHPLSIRQEQSSYCREEVGGGGKDWGLWVSEEPSQTWLPSTLLQQWRDYREKWMHKLSMQHMRPKVNCKDVSIPSMQACTKAAEYQCTLYKWLHRDRQWYSGIHYVNWEAPSPSHPSTVAQSWGEKSWSQMGLPGKDR